MDNLIRKLRKIIFQSAFSLRRSWGLKLILNSPNPNDLNDFQSSVPLKPYEIIQSLSAENVIEKAEEILISGYSSPKYPPISIHEPIPWITYEESNRSWSHLLHSWAHLEDFLSAYEQTKDRKYFDICLESALDWIEHFLERKSNSIFAWYDMAVGIRAYRLAYILDVALRVSGVPEESTEKLIRAIGPHLEYFSKDELISYHNNHGFYQAVGQLALARRLRFLEDREKIIKQALSRFDTILSNQFSEEGIHLEHSPDYHRMVYQSLRGIMNSGLIESGNLHRKAAQIEINLSRFILPNGNLLEFGDGISRNMFLSEKNAANWSTPEMQYFASRGLIGHPPAEHMAAFPKSGYWMVNDQWPNNTEKFEDNSYLAQMCGFHSRTHKHADDLTIVWFDRGGEILTDAGSYGYVGKTKTGSTLWKDGFWYDDPNRVYVESTRAHNVVEIDGRNYQRRGVKPYGSALSKWGTIDGVHFAETNLYHFKSIRCTRILFFKCREWLLVFDWLWDNNKQSHDFRQWFHLSEHFTVTSGEDYFEARNLKIEMPTLKIIPLINQPALSKIYLGETDPQLQGWRSLETYEMAPAPALAFVLEDQPSATFATLFSFSEQLETDPIANRVSTSGKKARFDWQTDTGKHSLLLDKTEQSQAYLVYKIKKDAGLIK